MEKTNKSFSISLNDENQLETNSDEDGKLLPNKELVPMMLMILARKQGILQIVEESFLIL